MAGYLTGGPSAGVGALSDVHSSARMPLGTRVQGVDATGNTAEYIYLQGVGSTIVGSVVTYDEAGVTTLIVGNAKGPVAVAMAILDSTSKYGWYGVQGTFPTAVKANSADNTCPGFETTAGYIGDGRAAGDQIANCFQRAATGGADAVVNVQFDHSYVDDFQGA